MTAYVELALSYLLPFKEHDAKCFIKSPAFSAHPSPTIGVRSSIGDVGTTLPLKYMGGEGGEGKFPDLEWDNVDGVKQWVLVSEDPDAPLPTPICHGIYLGIPADTHIVKDEDLEKVEGTKLKGGFWHGVNRRGTVYIPPRPLLNHGMHRYFFDVIALSEPLDSSFVESNPTREAVAKNIQGKILAWGRWEGQCERKWKW